MWEYIQPSNFVSLKIVGIGSIGSAIVNNLFLDYKQNQRFNTYFFPSAEFIAADIDKERLKFLCVPWKILLGEAFAFRKEIKNDFERGEKLAKESEKFIGDALKNGNFVFLIVSLEDSASIGAAQIFAETTSKLNAISIALGIKFQNQINSKQKETIAQGASLIKERVNFFLAFSISDILFSPKERNCFTLEQTIFDLVSLMIDVSPFNFSRILSLKNGERFFAAVPIGISRSSEKNTIKHTIESAILSLEESASFPVRNFKTVWLNIISKTQLSSQDILEISETVKQHWYPSPNLITEVTLKPDMSEELKLILIGIEFNTSKNGKISHIFDSQKNQEVSIPSPYFAKIPSIWRKF